MYNVRFATWPMGTPQYDAVTLDDVRIYSRALSGEEIELLKTAPQLNNATDINNDGVVNYLDWSIINK